MSFDQGVRGSRFEFGLKGVSPILHPYAATMAVRPTSSFKSLDDLMANLHTLSSSLESLQELRYKRLDSLDAAVAGGLTSLHKLKQIWIDLNHLKVIPEGALAPLTQLRDLRLGSNVLGKLPEDLPFATIRNLFISNNVITSLPHALCEKARVLEQLWADGNRIGKLPSNMGNIQSLEGFGVAHNLLSSLPSSMRMLTSLTALRVDHNDLESLPFLSHLTALTGLWIGGNKRLRDVQLGAQQQMQSHLSYVNAVDAPMIPPPSLPAICADRPPPIIAVGNSLDGAPAPEGVVVREPGTHEPPVFVGIGSNCQVAMDLSNLDVRGEAGPFDWVDSSATAIVTHFATRFARYPMPVPVAGGWWDASTDVSFHHDDFNGQREAEMAKYARRTARVVEALDRGGHVVLLRYGTLAETAAMCELGRAIHTAYGGATAVIYLLTAEVDLSHNQTISEGGICVCILHRNSILAVINRHCNS